MSVSLVDPATAPESAWPAAARDGSRDAMAARARTYVEEFARLGSQRLIANVRTRVLALRAGELLLPVTVNDGEPGNSYVCSPHTAYVSYAREELRLVPGGGLRALLGGVTDGAGALLRAARIDRIVHVNNWLLSTNLYGPAGALDPAPVAHALATRFPDHYLCFRSLNAWSDGPLLARLRAAGFALVASRQVYVFDDLDRTYAPREDSRRDRKLLRTTPYTVVRDEALGEADYARMAQLYALLYVGKYSRHNPVFTADYLRLCHRAGIMRFCGLRSPAGRLDGFTSTFALDDVVSSPIVGYDTAVAREAGLYRMLTALVLDGARRRGQRVNLSAGVGGFKRQRGGRPMVEYSAIYDRHLAPARRAATAALRATVNGLAVPLIRRLEL